MKCPKCQYISFDEGSRCRNCGYEFSLSVDPRALDLSPDPAETVPDRYADFSLEDLDAELSPPPEPEVVAPPAPPAPVASPAPRMTAARPITSSFDLPLFRAPDDDRPLVSAPAVPRAP